MYTPTNSHKIFPHDAILLCEKEGRRYIEIREGVGLMVQCYDIHLMMASYSDDTASEDSRAIVDEHIENCPVCRRVIARMHGDMSIIMKRKVRRRNLLIALIMSIVGIVAYNIFTSYLVPIEYYGDLVSVALEEESYFSWNLHYYRETSPIENYFLTMTQTGGNYHIEYFHRSIIRNGEIVHLCYFACGEYLSARLGFKNMEDGSAGFFFKRESNQESADRIEIYYVTSMLEGFRQHNNSAIYSKLNSMSDEEYDSYRYKGTLVWSGTLQ